VLHLRHIYAWLSRTTRNRHQKNTASVNNYEGFRANGEVVLRDRRGTVKSEIPTVSEKFVGDDPMAIYRPAGAKSVDAAKAMGNFTGWAYAAVNAIASEVANIQFRLYKINGDDQEEQDDHPLLTLLEGVNETRTGIELKYVTMAHLELTGNCYWLLDGVNNDTDQPRAIYLLNPGRVRVKLNKTSFPFKIDHYEFTIDGNIFHFQPYQILHIKYPDPGDPFVGIGVPQTIPVWIDGDNYAMEYNRKYFQNGAPILYVQSHTNVEGNINRIKQGLRDGYAGVENTQSACDDRTVNAITVPDHVARSLVPGECLRNCRATQSAVGYAVTLIQTRSLRPSRTMTKA
jgi:hypothetical protein